MKIRPHPPLKKSPVYAVQASFLALCIRRLEAATRRTFERPYDPDAGEAAVFWRLHEYQVFHDAAYACGFVSNDGDSTYPIEAVNGRPSELLGREDFDRLRQYVHTLLRAERSNRMDGYFSPVCSAVQSGALGVVASRLESDDSLYQRGCGAPGGASLWED